MPVIGKQVFKRINLPTAGAYVVVLTNPKSDLWKEVSADQDEETAGTVLLSKLITEWNFTDENDVVAPINSETVQQALSAFDIGAVMQELGLDNMILSDKKKPSSMNISLPKEQNQPPLNTPSSNTENASI